MRIARLFALWLLASAAPAGAQAGIPGAVAESCTDSAQTRGRVAGRVFSRADSTPIAGARVVARWPTQQSTLDSSEVRSDSRGEFTLCGLPLGRKAYLRADNGTGESDAVPVVVDQTAPRARVAIEIDVIEGSRVRAEIEASRDEPLKVEGARTISLDRYLATAGRGTIIGIVVVKETGQPLPYADLLIEPFGVATFTSGTGTFRVIHAPAGDVAIRARRIGFTAKTQNVVVRENATDTLRIELPSIALQLSGVRVTDAVCPDRRAGTVDSAIVTVLSQMQLNAERSRLMARAYPFEMVMRRTIANEGYDPGLIARHLIADTVQIDTVTATMEHGWRYAPGELIRSGAPTGNRKLGAPERMVVPQLVDFAEPAFLGAHCFKYAGITRLDGQRLIRVDFQPAKGVSEQIGGSLYFDPLTYQIQRSTLSFERNSPQQAGDIWVIRVDTWFREIVASLPVIDRIAQRTTLRTATKRDAWPGQAATEVQQLIDVRFLGRPPAP